jgi:hypothetical protein
VQKKSIRSVLIIILIILACSQIQGNTWKGEELKRLWKEAAWKVGPFRVQPMIMLTNAGYDSNVYGSPYDPVKDYTFTAGPGFYVYLPLKKKMLFALYESPQYVYFFETSRERTWNNYLRGDMHFLFNKILISVGGGTSDARERWNTEIDIRPRRKEESVRGEVLWQASKKTSFSLGYRRAKYDYENLEYEMFRIGEQLNREENYTNFVAYYQLTARTRFFCDAEYGFFDFENPLNFRDSQSYGVYSGFEFSPFGKIRGRIRLGYKFFDSKSPERQDYKGIVGDTSVQVRLLRPLSVRGQYRRDVQFSLWYDNTFFLENRVGGGASLYVHKKIRLDYDYSRGRNTYPQQLRLPRFAGNDNVNVAGNDNVSDDAWPKREDNYLIHSVGVYFRLKKNVGIGVTANWWHRDSNLEWENDKRMFIGVNLTYDF